jgi:tetratricopeptide (TPR) repeat protein
LNTITKLFLLLFLLCGVRKANAQFEATEAAEAGAIPVYDSTRISEPDNSEFQETIKAQDLALSGKTLSKKERVNAYLNRGYAKIRTDDKNGAIADYKAALQLDSTEDNAYHNLGLIYAKNEDCATAIPIVKKGIEKCKKKEDLYLLLANCLNKEGQYEQSLPYYNKAIELDPQSSLAYYNRGYAWFELKKNPEARKDFYQALYLREETGEGEFDLADTYFYMGTAYQNEEQNDSALVYLNLALGENKYWTYYSNKGTVLNDLQRYSEALTTLDEGITLFPDTADLYYARSNTYLGLKDYEKQARDLDKILSLDANHVNALINKAVYLEKQNKITDALRYYRKAVRLAPERFEPYANMANIYKDDELKQDSADHYYQKALKLAPDNAGIHFNYGNYFRKRSSRDAAIREYRQCLKMDPTITKAYNNLAALYFEKKQDSIAGKILLEGLAVNPDDENLNSNMLRYCFEHKQYDAAIGYATKVIQVNKHDINAIFKRGMSKQILGMHQDAIYDYQDCLTQLDKDEQRQNDGVYANIGYCYLELGELEPALKYFKSAVTYKPETDNLIGIFTVNYLLKNKADFELYFNKALSLSPTLRKGMKGITQLEDRGNFYSVQHKKILEEIFATQGIK